MSGARVLVVDDEAQIRRLLSKGLAGAGYDVTAVGTGEEALDAFADRPSDLVVLDLSMPGLGGLETCRRLRARSAVPIVILSVQEREADKVAALDLGADDYVTKPFGMGELLARLRALLRRANAPGATEPVFAAGPLRVDFARRLVTLDDQPLRLTPTEFAILKYLVVHADRVVTHGVLLREIRGDGFEAEPHYLHVYVNQLRRKLEQDPAHPRFILTEPGVGYRFDSQT
ncbi:MAG: DNA-binding response regulator KdpE [uncultured Thermomicrobiales bacterium]|uniref:DNA-binding response regulator KdpE n=1 Tax=uncultured Thermomicrobiales bacterium TaxID=1645740 RepID=A0A6J4VR12_9BACT|nr:MAG: DNA-binding response regulator KdpE [uncultured Thermomicrobiales bacterium]